jgi:solute carrier family 10 (sodium/bile acid cotransporter), member 7
VFGCLSVLVLTPAAALLALRLPLQPPELALGLAVFCCMPTALSAGVSLTQVGAGCWPAGGARASH